jgi:hypothetical protein
MQILLLIPAIALCIFWSLQFVQLMLLSDSDFPGKYDKCLWTAAFIFAFFFTPFAFMGWKSAYQAMVTAQREPKNQA